LRETKRVKSAKGMGLGDMIESENLGGASWIPRRKLRENFEKSHKVLRLQIVDGGMNDKMKKRNHLGRNNRKNCTGGSNQKTEDSRRKKRNAKGEREKK